MCVPVNYTVTDDACRYTDFFICCQMHSCAQANKVLHACGNASVYFKCMKPPMSIFLHTMNVVQKANAL